MLHVGLTAELGVELGQGVAGTDSSSESDSKPELEADSVLDSESASASDAGSHSVSDSETDSGLDTESEPRTHVTVRICHGIAFCFY